MGKKRIDTFSEAFSSGDVPNSNSQKRIFCSRTEIATSNMRERRTSLVIAMAA
jgi:hypothetical protein